MTALYQNPQVRGIIYVRCPECDQLTYDPRLDVCVGIRECDRCGQPWECDDQLCRCDPEWSRNPWAD